MYGPNASEVDIKKTIPKPPQYTILKTMHRRISKSSDNRMVYGLMLPEEKILTPDNFEQFTLEHGRNHALAH